MAGAAEQDPRRVDEPQGERDLRPVVDRPRSGISGGVLVLLALAAALLLFLVLNARRTAISAPAVVTRQADLPISTAPPPLYLPPPVPEPSRPLADVRPLPLPVYPMPSLPRSQTAPASSQPAYAPPPAVGPAAAPVQQPRSAGGPALVVDSSQAAQGGEARGGRQLPTSTPNPAGTTDRARAGMFANRATTVPQGTLIPAVLETGYDSTRPGFARALVQRDVRGFDGTQVLIPRGSRLIGEYGADVAPGQKRAMVAWSRLIRPDGVTVAIDSPAADPVGRGGVRANVNSHFVDRFAGAILQSSLDIGVNLAARAGDAPVILALPGSMQGTTGTILRPNEVRPTLTVPPGTSISVFVARDLDFTDVRATQ